MRSLSVTLRITTAALLAVAIFGCKSTSDNGGSADGELDVFDVGGTVVGLAGVLEIESSGFTAKIKHNGGYNNWRAEDGASYSVSIKTQPFGQTCTVANGSGIVNGADVTNIEITCGEAESVPAVAIAAGKFHTCAVTSAGSVQCWGDNSFGQLGYSWEQTDNLTSVRFPAVGLSGDVQSIYAAVDNTCAITKSNEVKCWGTVFYQNSNYGSEITTVTGFSSQVTAISSGEQFTCALTSAGSVQCWGYNYKGLGNAGENQSSSPVDVSGLSSGATAIAAGWEHACALNSSGGVQCWGKNDTGQLGNNSLTSSKVPVSVSGLGSGIKAIAAGRNHSCALSTGGAVQCWGANESGQLGNNTTAASKIAVTVSGLSSGVASIYANGDHTCALTEVGAAKCWGRNTNGQLGNANTADSPVPVAVNGLDNGVTAMALGWQHSCALLSSGNVKCWGQNGHGQLGTNNSTSAWIPVPVNGIGKDVVAMTLSSMHTCALTDSSAVKCWGYNGSGWTGENPENYFPRGLSDQATWTPITVTGLSDGATAVAGPCALTNSGAVRCWGIESFIPTTVSGLNSGVVLIAGQLGSTCALSSAGAVLCWGSLSYGPTPNYPGYNQSTTIPVVVTGMGTDVTALAVGDTHACALTSVGAVLCWGTQPYDRLSNSYIGSQEATAVSGLSSGVIAIAAGRDHTCALTSAGAVQCWGQNGSGQLGNKSSDPSKNPVAVSGMSSGIIAIAAGGQHSCAVTTVGAAFCWGENSSGQLGNNTTTRSYVPVAVSGLSSSVTAIVAGFDHTCALTGANEMYCWGGDEAGQVGDGNFSSRPVDVIGFAVQ